MPRRNKVVQTPANQGYLSLSGEDTTEVSSETKRARRRSEYGASRNTLANRKWGGSAITTGFRPEEHAGASRITPPTSTIKTRDESGISLPTQHLTATRKRDGRDGTAPKNGRIVRRGKRSDAPFTRFTSEDDYLRTQARTNAERRELTEYH
jgi:hypothetical protein